MSHTMAIERDVAERWHLREVGLWMFLGTVVMLFAAFTSALVVRRSGSDWVDVHLPSILWVNTAVLALSSVTLERARRAGAMQPRGALASIAATLLLGAVFCAGQIEAWRDLAAAGVFLPTTPAASFFYILTGLHVVHLVAALVCLAVLAAATVRPTPAGEWRYRAGMVSTFWHFLTGVWVYLLLVLQLT
jgi:cytochrome c oxidase subunit 3